MSILSLISSIFNGAKNDSYSGASQSWLTEDGSLKGSLNVLANDTKGASLVSVLGSHPSICNVLSPQKTSTFSVTYEGVKYTGKLNINKDGTVGFDLSSMAGKLNSLAQGETFSVSFYYVAKAKFLLDPAKVTVTITGTNDKPCGVVETFSAFEDAAVVAGTLDATDVDHGAVLSYALVGPAAAGFVLNPDGTYTFDAGNAAYQHLGAGVTQNVAMTYSVTDEFGASAQSTITITVIGVNDVAIIAGDDTGSVEVQAAVDTVVGQLTVNDADSGESAFQTAPVAGLYGDLVIDSDGTWTYTLDNSNTAVTTLPGGETLIDTVTVASLDGTTRDIVITINGRTDVAAIETGPSADDFDDLVFTATGATATAQADVLVGDAADNLISGLFGFDTIVGGAGNDTLLGNSGWDVIYGQQGDDSIVGAVGNDSIYGGSGDDVLIGVENYDVMLGGSGSDQLAGAGGNDTLIGGFGADTLSGGLNSDTFRFTDARDSGDLVTDFGLVSGPDGQDLLDVSAIDPNGSGSAFAWGGTTATAYGVWFASNGTDTRVFADTDGDRSTAELWFDVAGVTALVQTDFLL